MPRRRLGAVLLLPAAVAAEVDGLRRACGDGALGRVPSHITLVPPVNVRADDLPAALTRLRTAAAAAAGPLDLVLGPPGTFLPVNPVLYLKVGGPDLAGLHRVRDTAFAFPLDRRLSWPFVPHVTVADGAEPDRIGAALAALADYEAPVTLDRVHLLQEGEQRTWRPLADCPLGPPDLVGRGGFELELTTSDLLDPEAAAFVAAVGVDVGGPPFVVARHRWSVLGVSGSRHVLVAPDHRDHGVADHLARRRPA
ncbi:MAG: 2'-5' RNA ligase family protein [Acidimicrobiales bacterium]